MDVFKTQIRGFTDSQIRRFVDCTRLDTEIASVYTTTIVVVLIVVVFFG